MNQLSIESKTHAVITYSGIHYLITAIQYEKMSKMGKDDMVELEGNIVKGANIADIITIQVYEKNFPKKFQNNNIPEYKNLSGMGMDGIINNTNDLQAIEQMIIGIKRAITKMKNPQCSPDFLKKMETKKALILMEKSVV